MSNLLGVFQTFGENFVRRLQMQSSVCHLQCLEDELLEWLEKQTISKIMTQC